LIERAGFTGMLLPQVNGFPVGDTMRTLNGSCSVLERTRVYQMLPAAESTSSMPYSADPAVSFTATLRTSVGLVFVFMGFLSRVWGLVVGSWFGEDNRWAVPTLPLVTGN
jgi:hypothetical protein